MTETAVTSREKIKYLKRYITIDREVDHKLRELDHWRSKLVKITTSLSAEPKGGGSIYGRTEDIVARIVDLEQELDADIDRLIDIRASIKSVIDAVEDDRERSLLQCRYLEGKTFEWIAADMQLSWKWIHNLHSRALDKIRLQSS